MTVAIRLTVVSLGVLLILQVSIVSGQVCELPIPDTCDTTVPYTRQNQPYGAPCTSLPGECAATLICRLGVCSCPDGNDFINNICAVAPGFGAPCTQGRCKSPVLCDATGYCNQCPAGFNSTGFGCTAACGVNDIRTENGCLPPVTAVGGQCQDSSQCQVGYSQCINFRCTCALGTQQIGNSCQPAIIRCPFGEAFKFQNGSVQSCKTVVCSATINRPAMEVSGCPFDYTCFRTSLQLDSGVCCPNEKPWCPIGEPLLDRSCNDSLIGQPLPPPPPSIFNTIQPVNGGIYNGADGRCPTKTHYCHRAGVTHPTKGGYCCPLPCPNLQDQTTPTTTTVSIVDGLCVKRTPLNSPCQTDYQCPENALCDPTLRICVCRTNFIQQVATGDITGEQRCVQRCNAPQISIANGCYDVALPMAPCAFTSQCTQGGTVCRGGKCQCKCGEYLQNSQCIPSPTCPTQTGSDPSIKIVPLSDQYGFHDCSPTTVTSGVDICGRYGGYCATIGLSSFCCPLPAPTCPAGQSPTFISGQALQCALQTVSAECPPSTYCYDYISAVIQPPPPANANRGICCSNSANSFGGINGVVPIG